MTLVGNPTKRLSIAAAPSNNPLGHACGVSQENVTTALAARAPTSRDYRGNATVVRMNTKYTADAAITRMWNTSW